MHASPITTTRYLGSTQSELDVLVLGLGAPAPAPTAVHTLALAS
jgi:hypothetical protein